MTDTHKTTTPGCNSGPTGFPGKPGPASAPVDGDLRPTHIKLLKHEIQSNYDRVQWAEGLIKQLPETHEGRNSWLLNYEGEKHKADKVSLALLPARTPEPDADVVERAAGNILDDWFADRFRADPEFLAEAKRRIARATLKAANLLRAPAVDEGLHPETAKLVRDFAAALAGKLRAAELKYGYRDGWLTQDWADEGRQHLYKHLAKGDPRDVAAYCAFMWKRGWSTNASPGHPPDRDTVARKICQSGKFETGEGTCAFYCMDQLGDARKNGCRHAVEVHGKLADSILDLYPNCSSSSLPPAPASAKD